jgi:hypothetical protein
VPSLIQSSSPYSQSLSLKTTRSPSRAKLCGLEEAGCDPPRSVSRTGPGSAVAASSLAVTANTTANARTRDHRLRLIVALAIGDLPSFVR